MKCIYCQKDIMDNTNICPNCGSIQPNKGNNKPIIIIGIIIVVLLVAILSFLIINNKNSNSNNNDYSTSTNEDSDRYEEDIEKEEGKDDILDEEDDKIIDKPSNMESEIKVYEFYGEGCGYCKALNTWFESIEDEYGEYYELVKYEVWLDAENASLMEDVAEYLNITVDGVPFIVIGDKYEIGYSETTSPKIILNLIMEEYNKPKSERIDVIEEVKR